MAYVTPSKTSNRSKPTTTPTPIVRNLDQPVVILEDESPFDMASPFMGDTITMRQGAFTAPEANVTGVQEECVAAYLAEPGSLRLMDLRFLSRVGFICLVCAAVRRMSRRSGATDTEFHGQLPGDDLLPHPMLEWTRATTIDAPPERVWPWLVQMGYGRGGWYTSERFDRIVWRIENKSSDEILDEWQHLQVGDIVPDGPDYAAYFRVDRVDQNESIVYRSIRHPFRGHPVDPTDPEALEEMEHRLIDGGVYLDFSWAFVLRSLPMGQSRLLVRTRANYEPPWFRVGEIPLGLVDFYHVSTMFRGIALRAEGG